MYRLGRSRGNVEADGNNDISGSSDITGIGSGGGAVEVMMSMVERGANVLGNYIYSG